jgi:hypothetical protein
MSRVSSFRYSVPRLLTKNSFGAAIKRSVFEGLVYETLVTGQTF